MLSLRRTSALSDLGLEADDIDGIFLGLDVDGCACSWGMLVGDARGGRETGMQCTPYTNAHCQMCTL